jgi:hypothetical protein
LVYTTVAGTVHFVALKNGCQISEADFGLLVDNIQQSENDILPSFVEHRWNIN